jgi:tetratricopeptide (TPR) repeat protein
MYFAEFGVKREVQSLILAGDRAFDRGAHYASALAMYGKAIKLDPHGAHMNGLVALVYYRMAECMQKLGKSSRRAIRFTDKAYSFSILVGHGHLPSETDIWLLRARLWSSEELYDLDQAITAYDHAIGLLLPNTNAEWQKERDAVVTKSKTAEYQMVLAQRREKEQADRKKRSDIARAAAAKRKRDKLDNDKVCCTHSSVEHH